jgi:hypothetical protein
LLQGQNREKREELLAAVADRISRMLFCFFIGIFFNVGIGIFFNVG